jgi:hypothetical protein
MSWGRIVSQWHLDAVSLHYLRPNFQTMIIIHFITSFTREDYKFYSL